MIEVINQEFLLQGIITNYESVIFNRSWSGVGTFEIHINKNKKNVDKLVKGNFIMMNKKINRVGIIEDINIDCNNTRTLIASGKQLKGITNRRLTVSDTYDRVDETEAENVFKHYVQNHMVNSYYNDIPTPERNIEWLNIAISQNRGLRTVWQSRFEYLDDLFEHISEDTRYWLGYCIRFSTEMCFF